MFARKCLASRTYEVLEIFVILGSEWIWTRSKDQICLNICTQRCESTFMFWDSINVFSIFPDFKHLRANVWLVVLLLRWQILVYFRILSEFGTKTNCQSSLNICAQSFENSFEFWGTTNILLKV